MLRKIIKALLPLIFITGQSFAAVTIVALVPDADQFHTVIQAIKDELGSSYRVEIIDIREPPGEATMLNRCKRWNAKAVILMDSKAVKAAQAMQKSDSAFAALPKFVYMTLMADATAAGLSNACGIFFEVPLFTLVTKFRIISAKDFLTVGVFYRKSYSKMIEETARLLRTEKIALRAECIDSAQTGAVTQETVLEALKNGFNKMKKGAKPDVLVVTADNLILNNASLNEFWLGEVKDRKIPVIAPLAILTSKDIAAAAFAVEPDLPQLGAQAANQIFECLEKGVKPVAMGFQQTISVISTVNSKVAEDIGWGLKAEKLSGVNSVVK